MCKVQPISSFQAFFPIFVSQDLKKQEESFFKSELGKIRKAIPWQELVKEFKTKTKRKGPKCIFDLEGQIALMFLKSYSQMSDKQLIEQLNGNIHYQFFCGFRIPAGEQIKNYKIVSHIRCQLSKVLNIQAIQNILAKHWAPYVSKKSKVIMDATCYESSVRYPTDQKLLWESVVFLYRVMKHMCKKAGFKLIRTKFKDWEARYKQYSRKRRKSKKERKSLTRALLRLLKKLDESLDLLEKKYEFEDKETYQKQREIIKKVLEQQQQILLKENTQKIGLSRFSNPIYDQ